MLIIAAEDCCVAMLGNFRVHRPEITSPAGVGARLN
jgi:hypothetical protein